MNKKMSVFVAGHNGMVGSALVRGLKARGYHHLILRDRRELDLTDQAATQAFFSREKPEIVVDAAAKVGGILANNTLRAEFIYRNLMIQANLIHSAWQSGTKKLLFLGSSCIYPRMAEQPIRENALLTGPLEYTNEPYAIAKIAGIKMCESYFRQYGCDFISAMPTNLYGPNDNFDLQTSHVLPALIRKFHDAKVAGLGEVTIWGSGTPRREFMHVDDMAAACIFLLENLDAATMYDTLKITHVNVGTGTDIRILELAEMIAGIVGFEGKILTDTSMPDGTPRKLMDSSMLHSLGFSPSIGLEEGIRAVYQVWLKESGN